MGRAEFTVFVLLALATLEASAQVSTAFPVKLPPAVHQPSWKLKIRESTPLQFILNTTTGVQAVALNSLDDTTSQRIPISTGFPFGNSIQSAIYVGTNGIISFGAAFNDHNTVPFPGTTAIVTGSFLVAPFWSDVDIEQDGQILYEVHNSTNSDLLDQVSSAINNNTDAIDFSGTWMLVARWDNVSPYPAGTGSQFLIDLYNSIFNDVNNKNTYEAILITDGQSSYAIFVYRCGLMEWSRSATIGYNAAGDFYTNEEPYSGNENAHNIACSSQPDSEWHNVYYNISLGSPNSTVLPPTIEPPQNYTLMFLEETGINNGSVTPCDDCSSDSIDISDTPFPFGNYRHDSVHVGTNGIISFGEEYTHFDASLFPTTLAASYYSYVVAPYWADIDNRADGRIYWEIHTSQGEALSQQLITRVNDFIFNETTVSLGGTWMMVTTWEDVYPWPHGSNPDDPNLQFTNTFQAILITNTTKSYAIFTYKCHEMEWSGEGVIGLNAAGTHYENHPLGGTAQSNEVACVHFPDSVWNNVIYDLVPGSLTDGTTPPPFNSIGSCVVGGYMECCEDGVCSGEPADCFCDQFCRFLDDCCADIDEICSTEGPPGGNGTYLLFANLRFINRVNLDGSGFSVLVDVPSGGAVGVDFHHSRGMLLFSDVTERSINIASLNTSNTEVTVLLNDSLEVVDDLAVDWINDKVYWTDAVHARIEVIDIDSKKRKELLRTGPNSVPRAIAVDPSTRWMYWTDWGEPAKIERASMDGTRREVLTDQDLVWPNGLTIDYVEQRIYWADAFLDKIEYSFVDGTVRIPLDTSQNGIDHPFAITLENNLVFWTERDIVAIFSTHKTEGENHTFAMTFDGLFISPFGIEAITPDRQADLVNPCDGNMCSDLCLLSSNSSNNYVCACPDGAELNANGMECNSTGVTPPPTDAGTCDAAGYTECCSGGFCAGSPPTCYCDVGCHTLGDCCEDIDDICSGGSCRTAGYETCCTDGACIGEPSSALCYCDETCEIFQDCCDDYYEICRVTPSPTPTPTAPPGVYLPFITFNVTEGVTTQMVPVLDDGASQSIVINTGFAFGNSLQPNVYVSTNGIISFGIPFYNHQPFLFPSIFTDVSSQYLVAPFWSDVDIRNDGAISFEVHTIGNETSEALLSNVSNFISNYTGDVFLGTWMLVAFWEDVGPFPAGSTTTTNTYQGVVITDGQNSYSVFIYQCGLMEWSGGATIGFNAAGDFYVNHPFSGSTNTHEIACESSPESNYQNIVYKLSLGDSNSTVLPPTVEPAQDYYLMFLEETGINNGSVTPCDDCSSDSIDISDTPFPFGNYRHDSVHVGTNGIISFGEEYTHFDASLFPTTLAASYYSYVVAPYWADVDNRADGRIYWEIHTSQGEAVSQQLITRVNDFIFNETTVSLGGTWMMVTTWEDVYPWPHGSNPDDPNLQSTNTFQAILITNTTKSYVIFTYKCHEMEWSGEGVIGFNAAGTHYDNHPLSGTLQSNLVACVHFPDSLWNNVIYDLVPGSLIDGTTPPPFNSIGSCATGGYAECCEDGVCSGEPADCFCDQFCRFLDDCCADIDETCPTEGPPGGNGTYLLFANLRFINRVNLDGSGFSVLVDVPSGGAVGVDFHHSRGKLLYSDVVNPSINMASLNVSDSEVTVLLNDSLEVVDDLAVDWINDKVYWTDGVHARIEVIDIESKKRKELLRTGPNSIPRAIAVDPSTRWMYWTDWGEPAKIERASMDGTRREVLTDQDLVWPNGLTIDYVEQRIYWADAFLDKIEYSFVDGTVRIPLDTSQNGIDHPFAITLENNLVFWTERDIVAIFSTHKTEGENHTFAMTFDGLFISPFGIEAITPDRQADVVNPCDGNVCSDLCLLSSNSSVNGFVCACPDGAELTANGTECNFTGVTPPPINATGTCAAAGYTDCCSGGFCAGSPPTCFCDQDCHALGDCCEDIDDICAEEIGSCRTAGYETCCTDGVCIGEPSSALCYCDETCEIFQDCCDDYYEICGATPSPTPSSMSSTSTSSPSFSPTEQPRTSSVTPVAPPSTTEIPSPAPSSMSSSSTASLSTELLSTSSVIPVAPSSTTKMTPSSTIEPTSTSSTSSSSSSVTVPPTVTPVPIQLRFLGVEKCTDWISTSTNTDDILTATIEKLGSQCQCLLSKDNFKDAVLQCFSNADAVTLRVNTYSSETTSTESIFDAIMKWLSSSSPNITVKDTLLKVDANCEFKISDLTTSKNCDDDTSVTQPQNTAGVIAGPTITIIAVIVIVLVVAVVLVFIILRKKRSNKYLIFDNEGQLSTINPTESALQVNPNDYQQVSAATASPKKEALTFEKGVATVRYQPLDEEGGLEDGKSGADIGYEVKSPDGPPGVYYSDEDVLIKKEAEASHVPASKENPYEYILPTYHEDDAV